MATATEGRSFTQEQAFSPEREIPSLNLIFNGQGELASKLLETLVSDGHRMLLVVATKKEDDPVRMKAEGLGIPIINLGVVNKPENQQTMKNLDADLAVGFFLQATLYRKTYSAAKYGTINFHISDLPKRRGRDSMNWAILDGDPEIGASMFLMNERIDAGPIVKQIKFKNPGDQSQGALYFKHKEDFIELARGAVNDMADAIEKRKTDRNAPLPLIVQDENLATYQDPLREEDLRVDPLNDSADKGKRKVLAGGPGATLMVDDQKYKLGKPIVSEGPPLIPGRIIEMSPENGLVIELNQGILSVGRFQKV